MLRRFIPGFVLFALVSLSLLPAAAQASSLEPPADVPEIRLEDFAREVEIQAKIQDVILSRPGVIGVGLGYRNGAKTLVVLADEEMPEPRMRAEYGGLPAVVERTGHPTTMNGGEGCSPLSPILGGYSGCHAFPPSGGPVPMGFSTGVRFGPGSSQQLCQISAGTLGFKACQPSTGKIGYVTNNHVAALTTAGCPNAQPGVQLQAPGAFETYPTCNWGPIVGTLSNRSLLVPGGRNFIDAAFVESSGAQTSNYIQDIGYPLLAGAPVLNACVRKSGRTTGLTHGRIDLVNLTHYVTYPCLGRLKFEGSFRVKPDSSCGSCTNQPCTNFVKRGDSGSAIIGADQRLVGLFFAGSGNGKGYASPAQTVLSFLGLSLTLYSCS